MITVLTITLLIFSILVHILQLFISITIFNITLIKFILACIFFATAKYIYLHPYKKKLKLSYIRQRKYENHLKYKIQDENELDICIAIFIIYFIFFVIILFVYKIKNSTKTINLNDYINKILIIIESASIFNSILNILLIISILLLYFQIISLILKYIKYNMFKLYFYNFLSFHDKHNILMLKIQDHLNINYYTVKFRLDFLPKILENLNIHSIFLERLLSTHIDGLQFIIHRLILLIVISYDILFNNMILTNMFKIIPYIFIYELWTKLSICLTGLNMNCDFLISRLLYNEITELPYDIEYLYLNNEPFEKKTLKEVITTYAYHEFIDQNQMPQNPINEGVQNIIIFWKQNIFVPLFKKYHIIDIFFAFIVITYISIYSIILYYNNG